MMKKVRKERKGYKSIRTLLMLAIIPTVILSMSVLSIVGYGKSREIIERTAESGMEQCLNAATASVQKSMEASRMVTETMARGAEMLYRQPSYPVQGNADWKETAYSEILTEFVKSNTELFGGGIWFEPYAYRADKQFFSPYCMKENGEIRYVDNYSLGEGVFYTDQDWYQSAKNTTKSVVWSTPYHDDFANISMVTASAPFYNTNGQLLGVATTDLDLSYMQKIVSDLDVAAGGRALMVDQSGVYIADEDSEKLLRANILQDKEPSLAAFAKEMLGTASGSGKYTMAGEEYRAWYQQVPESGWYIITTTSEENLMAEANALGKVFTMLCIGFGILLFIALFWYLKIRIINPVHALAASTQQIAKGQLSVELRDLGKTEFGVMGRSIQKMALRLKHYTEYIAEISDILGQMAAGDFKFELKCDYTGEFAGVKEGLLTTRDKLSDTLNGISKAADQVNSGANQISLGAQAQAQGATEQASNVEELAAMMIEIEQAVDSNTQNTMEVNDNIQTVIEKVGYGDQKMNHMLEAMDEISTMSNQIGKIVKSIEDIAFQTNILALNAAVEAARAGAAGKGFAVVADEVRNLASKTAEASGETAELITKALSAIEKGKQIADETADSFHAVTDDISDVATHVGVITEHSLKQKESIQQAAQGIDKISSIVQTNAATAQESAAASEELFGQAHLMRDLVGKFQLHQDNL